MPCEKLFPVININKSHKYNFYQFEAHPTTPGKVRIISVFNREIQFTQSYISVKQRLDCDPNDYDEADMIFNSKIFCNLIELSSKNSTERQILRCPQMSSISRISSVWKRESCSIVLLD